MGYGPLNHLTEMLEKMKEPFRLHHQIRIGRKRSKVFGPALRSVLRSDPCVYCGRKSAGLDHIIPLSDGGANGWLNRAPACRACDSHKASIALIHFMMRARRFGK